MATTSVTRRIRAPRAVVYRALLDAEDVQRWMVPDGMTSEVHAFDPREGGEFRVSLTYDTPTGTGKTTARTDSYHGRFLRLVPDTEVVQVVEFETDDPQMTGEMTITYRFSTSRASLSVDVRHPSSLSAGVTPGGRFSCTPTSSVPPSASRSR